MHITYTLQESMLGQCLIAWTDKGICALLFEDPAHDFISDLKKRFPQASLTHAPNPDHPWVMQAVQTLNGAADVKAPPLDLHGTDFQRRVWAALRQIPTGKTQTYTQLAQLLNMPKAVRAVAQACGANPVAVLVPCHRVIRQDGTLAGYRWGLARKERLLMNEAQDA
jgi:AraC family transcriptional regulator of adaptative response/methylated-DNA-[protein]-cysteine methyltransferase